jgi:hypothetical protein
MAASGRRGPVGFRRGGESGRREVPAGPVLRAGGGPTEETALSGTHAETGDSSQFIAGFDPFGDEEALTSFAPQQHRPAPRRRHQPDLTTLICEGPHNDRLSKVSLIFMHI